MPTDAARRFGATECFAFLMCAIALFSVGCSGEKGPKRYGVSGTVALDGKPVPKGVVSLVPDVRTKGPGAGAEIVEGKFTIPAAKGPIAGTYIFQFEASSDIPVGEAIEMKGGLKRPNMRPLIPLKYGALSTESRQIGPEATHFDFDLKGN